MGLRAIKVDDVEREARKLASMVLASPLGRDAQVRTCSDVDALEDLLGVAGGVIDVVFMDVRLGERSGIDAIERLLPLGGPTQVVYVSGFDESQTRVYRTEHTSYLRKPLRQEDVSLALEQVRARQADAGANPVVMRHDHVVDFVRPRDIACAESDRRHVLVHTRSGELRVYGKLSELEAQLPASFARCHQSYLINLDYVARLSQECVRLVTGVELPVSRRWRPALKEALFSRVRRGLS